MTREEAINILSWMPENFNMLGAGCVGEREAINMSIEALKAEPLHGEWISTGDQFPDDIAECSVCGHRYEFGYNFCPNCGAKMDGGKS